MYKLECGTVPVEWALEFGRMTFWLPERPGISTDIEICDREVQILCIGPESTPTFLYATMVSGAIKMFLAMKDLSIPQFSQN